MTANNIEEKEKKNKEIKKIVVMGLDNSGKTSIVLNLMDKVNLLNYLSLSPTVGVKTKDFHINNKVFNIWDLGGQKTYRENYLKDFDDFVQSIDKLIYVIDVQDIKRYPEALNFFREVIERLEKRELYPEISIYIHKYDPNLLEIQPKLNNGIINDLINNVKNMIPDNFFHDIYKTTIYTVFDKKYVI
ncbi:MAG: GTP-binding protein [Promethearchaeota archaeon]|nr:MAG: GTP-binding protein [Candidatus Lokiarchaeota archaeon]